MITKIPDKFSKSRPIIERLYRDDETFREIYIDYQTYFDALKFWEQSSSNDSPARLSEYQELANELEVELTKILDRIDSVKP